MTPSTDTRVSALCDALEPFAKVCEAFEYWCAEVMPDFEYPLSGTNLDLAREDCPEAIGILRRSDFERARAALAKARAAS